MFSDRERRLLEELEARLVQEDPQLAETFASPAQGSRRRRIVSVCIAALAVAAAVTGLMLTSVPTVVIALCVLGVAAGLWLSARQGS